MFTRATSTAGFRIRRERLWKLLWLPWKGAEYGVAFSSGVAAADAILKCLRPGDHVLCSNDLYGGNYRLFRQVYGPLRDPVFDFLDMQDLEQSARQVYNACHPA